MIKVHVHADAPVAAAAQLGSAACDSVACHEWLAWSDLLRVCIANLV
jgi:hypothetical protein